MKMYALALTGVGAFAFAGAAQADFTGASIVNMGSLNPNGGTTYQIFANFDSPNDVVLAVSGNAGVSALIYDGGELVQNQLIPNSQLGDVPTAGIVGDGDSWVSIGDPSTQNTAFSPDFLGGNGSSSVINGTYFIQDDNGGYFDQNPGSEEGGGSVLIAQFTMDGDFSYQGTVDYNDADDGLTSMGFSVTTVPAPGAMALLGLAGLAGTRRRRA